MSIDAFPPTGTDTDATLDAIAGLSTSANTMPYFTGVDTAALTPLTPFMRTLLDDPDLATAQATLGITGGGGGAPTDAEYIVGSTNGTLTQERVLTPTPTVSWDLTTPGQAKAVVQDASITEAKLNMSDVTTTNVSTTAHGLTPKLSGVATQYLDGTGAWTVPPAGTTYTDEQAQDAVGAMLTDTATIDLTYGDGGPTLQADVKDSSITEAKLAFVDVATRDASVSAHGLLRKLSGVSTQYLDGSGAWTVPPAGTTYTDEQAQDAVGAMLTNTSTVNLTYVDATPAFSAMVNDASITEAKLSLSDVATKDASTTAHGLLRKLSGTPTQYLDGSGAWTTPAGGGTNYWSRAVLTSAAYSAGLLAFWKLEEASGNRVDSVASMALVPQGTVAQITNGVGKTGQALKLNATAGTYLSIADNATLSAGTSSFTIACWVIWDAAPSANPGLVGKGNGSVQLSRVEYMLWYSGGVLRFNVGNNSTNVDLAYTGLTPVAGTWYFVVGWYDAVLDIQYMQVNNGAIVSAANPAGSFDSADAFEVGRQTGWSSSPTLNGRIDNVMFFKRVLTDTDRTAWYNAGAGQDYPPTGMPVGVVTPVVASDMVALGASPDTPAGTTDGTLRWTGTDFEGRKGGAWVSMTSGGGGQPLDATLTALAGLATGADQLPYATGTDTFAQTPLTAFARTLLDDTTQAAMRSTLALTPGTDVQAQDAELQAIAGLTSAADRVPYFTGTGTAALATFTAAGRTLAGAADAAAQRTALGLGTMAQQDANAVDITGGSAVLTGGLNMLNYGATNASGIYIQQNSAGGANRWGINCAGDAPNFMGGWLRVPQLGIGGALDLGGQATLTYDKTAKWGLIILPTGSDGGGFNPMLFKNVAGGGVGSITTNGSGTAYNTSSDVRLKHAITPLTGALDVVQALRPVRFRWNADDSLGHGFLAHELQQVVPDAVTGEPDAVHEDGSVKPQGVDHSRLVPWLTAAIKELSEKVQILQSRLDALTT